MEIAGNRKKVPLILSFLSSFFFDSSLFDQDGKDWEMS
jgi:hypothetical protein